MPSGRLEKEQKMFKKIENKLSDMPDIFSEYYYSLRAEKKSYRTIDEYLKSVNSFMLYESKGKNSNNFYKNVRPIHISKYMTTLETKNINGKIESTSSGYRANNWYALKSFFDFLKDSKYIDESPIRNKTRPKITDNPSVTYLNGEEIKKMMEVIKKEAKEDLVNRDLCIFALGVTTGLRVAAIAQINMEDIDLSNNIIRVIEKRNKTFDVLMGETLKTFLLNWINDREKYFNGAKTDALFVSRNMERISYSAIRKLLDKYATEATNKHFTPHVMRHSCATNLYEKTGDIYLCAAQLHHSNVKTTQRYADITDESMKKAANVLDDLI